MFWTKLKQKQIIFLVITLIVFFSVILFWQPKDLWKIKLLPIEKAETDGVLYIINRGEENISEYQIEISNNSTVFSLLEELAEKEDFETETSFYSEMGVFVESIDGFKGGTDNKWWQYWINGKLGEVAADKKQVKAKDVIEWKFEVPLEF